MRKLKVIRLTTLLDFGGQEQQYISFTETKGILKQEYIIGAIGYGGYASDLIAARGFRVILFNRSFQIASLANLWNIWVLFRFFRKEQASVVHTAAAEANFFGVIAAWLAGVDVIIAEEIGIPAHSASARFIFKWVYKLTDAVICVSEAVKKHLIELDEIKAEQGIVLYNPVTKMMAKVPDQRMNQFEIVCVGRLEIVKNQKKLIEALAKLDREDVHLTLVGDGRERENLENLVKNSGIQDRVTFVGFSSDPAFYLSRADLFVLPSLSEGFGIAAVEAMQLGLACLCSNVGGIPEFIQHNETGWLFDPLAEDDLLLKLISILSLPPDEIARIGLRGQAYVEDLFSTSKYVHSLEALYERLYERKAGVNN